MARKAAKKELLKELKGGIASVRLVGTARIGKDSFGGVQQKEKSTWKHVDSSFGIESGEGNVNYAQLKGGYKTDKPILYLLDEDFKPMQIDWEDRNNPEIIETVSQNRILTAAIEKDEKGKLIRKKFLSEIDFEEYLSVHLQNNQQIIAMCDVEYSEWNEKTYRNFKLRSVFLNEERKINNETVPARKPEATLRQTYLLNEGSLDRNWQKQLEKDGATHVNAFVPQYVGKISVNGEYVEVKQTLPFSQRIKIEIPETVSDEKLPKLIALYKKLFVVKKGAVREISLVMRLNEGYEEAVGEAEITPEMQELIDCGIMTAEEVEQDVTVRGDKVSETIFVKPGFRKLSEEAKTKEIAMDDDKYDPEALVWPDLDDDLDEDEIDLDDDDFNNEDESAEDKDEKEESSEDDEEDDGLDGLFDDEDIFA